MNYQRFLNYFNTHDNYSASSGMQITELSEGYAKIEMDLGKNSTNYMGIMHGGLYGTMADIAGGTAAISYGSRCVTLNSHIDYIKPAKTGHVTAEGRVIAREKR